MSRFLRYFLHAEGSDLGSGGGDDLTGLKTALTSERKRAEAAEKKLKEMETQQELSNKTLAEQVAALQGQLAQTQTQYETERQQLTGQLTQRDIRSAFVNAYGGSKGLPEYADVLYAHLGANLQLSDGKVVTKEGKPLDVAIAAARSQFPAMFAPENVAAGSGVSPSSSNGSSSVRLITASDTEAVRGVNPDDLVSGKVVLDLEG